MSSLFSYVGNPCSCAKSSREKFINVSNMAQGTLFSYFGKAKKTEGQTSVNTPSKEWMKPGELVWAKMEGYSQWPAMLTNHHVDRKMLRDSKSDQECHVQFFGEPPTRGWVLVRYAIDKQAVKSLYKVFNFACSSYYQVI